jgi:hypothetical protein
MSYKAPTINQSAATRWETWFWPLASSTKSPLHSRHVVHALSHVTFFYWFGLRGADDGERDQAHEDGKSSKLHDSVQVADA